MNEPERYESGISARTGRTVPGILRWIQAGIGGRLQFPGGIPAAAGIHRAAGRIQCRASAGIRPGSAGSALRRRSGERRGSLRRAGRVQPAAPGRQRRKLYSADALQPGIHKPGIPGIPERIPGPPGRKRRELHSADALQPGIHKPGIPAAPGRIPGTPGRIPARVQPLRADGPGAADASTAADMFPSGCL